MSNNFPLSFVAYLPIANGHVLSVSVKQPTFLPCIRPSYIAETIQDTCDNCEVTIFLIPH